MQQTIFERYGGFATVRKVVSTFYDYVLEDEVTAPYFAGVDMRSQIDHQSKFVSAVMGGPGSYTDEHLQRVDAGAVVVDHLDEARGLPVAQLQQAAES